MMKSNMSIFLMFSAAFAVLLCGCGPSAPEGVSPAERNALVIRMFRSMEKGDSVSAAAQAAKVRAYDSGNAHFSWIIEVQECNQLMAKAQTAMDAGHLAEAEDILQDARRRYPLQPFVAEELKKVRQFRHFLAAVKTYCAAKNLADRERALKVVSRQAESLRDPALNAQISRLQKDLAKEIAAELAARQKAGKNAAPKP